jgi:hypothetical protein
MSHWPGKHCNVKVVLGNIRNHKTAVMNQPGHENSWAGRTRLSPYAYTPDREVPLGSRAPLPCGDSLLYYVALIVRTFSFI